MKKLILCGMLLLSFYIQAQTKITKAELREHLSFLSADSLAGRYPGTKANKQVVDHIVKDFKKNGIDTYLQPFKAKMRKDSSVVDTWNVIGVLRGTDEKLKNEVIILGAHYDHLGKKGKEIYNGADDNASGSSALLEISERLAAHKDQLKRTVLFIAFGAEEQGLLGSRYFAENSLESFGSVKVMLNMDMIGRLNEQKHLYINGAGTFPKGVEMMKKLGENYDLTLIVFPGSVGGSDHVSFYKKDISALGFHTGAHDQYHKPSDTIDLINFKGLLRNSNYIYEALLKIANTDTTLEFVPQD